MVPVMGALNRSSRFDSQKYPASAGFSALEGRYGIGGWGDRWRAAAEVDSFPSPGRVSPVTGVARQCCTDCAGYRAFSGRVAKIVTLRHDDDFRDEFCSGTLWFTVLHPERCASPVPRLGLARTSRRCVGRVADLVSTVPAMNSWADRVIAEILDSVDALVADPHRQMPSTGTDAEEER